MLRCPDLTEQITELVGGRLSPEAADALMQHVNVCPACRDYLEECWLEAHVQRGLPPPHPPHHLKDVLGERGRD